MDNVTITRSNRPAIAVHRGWTPVKKRGNFSKSASAVDQRRFLTKTFSISSRKGKRSTAILPEQETHRISPNSSTASLRKTGQQIEFINDATEPLHTKDAAVRKLVRSHVMKEVVRERREQQLRDIETKSEEAKRAEEASLPRERLIEQFPGGDVGLVPPARHHSALCFPLGPYHFVDFSSQLQANIRRLAALYFTKLGSAVFPMEFHLAYNPPKQLQILDFTIADDAVFQSVLYTAAVSSTLAEGKSESYRITMQMSLTIRRLNRLLQAGMGWADGMLGAVSNLAVGEALRGYFKDWAIHMVGLKKIVEMRGGMDKIHFYLRMKLYRADLMGSIDQVIRPFFHFKLSRCLAIYSNPSLPAYDTLLDSPTAHMELRALLPQFADMLTELRDFSRVREQSLLMRDARLDPTEFVETCYSIQYKLLTMWPIEDVSDEGSIRDNNELGEAFRLGAIIYLKEILPEFTFSAIGSMILVSKLTTFLRRVLTSEATPGSMSLHLWLLIVGGVASVKSGMDRTLFLTHLVRLRCQLGLDIWDDVKGRLESVLWIGKLLDEAGKGFWEEVEFQSLS